MDKAASAYKLFPNDETIFSLYRLLTYGQQRMVEAESLSQQASSLYNNKEFEAAASLFQQAFDKDPLQHTYSLNAGLGYYEAKQYDKAIQLFDLALTSKNEATKERALRYKGLSLFAAGRGPAPGLLRRSVGSAGRARPAVLVDHPGRSGCQPAAGVRRPQRGRLRALLALTVHFSL